MPKPEMAAQGAQPLPSLALILTSTCMWRNFDNEIVIGIACEPFYSITLSISTSISKSVDLPWKTVTGYLILEVHLANGRSYIMRMKTLLGRDVLQSDLHAVIDMNQRQIVISDDSWAGLR
jgi:hypothetical protein